MGIRVVHGVVLSTIAFTTESQVQTGDTQVLEERGIIGAGTQSGQGKAIRWGHTTELLHSLPAIVYGDSFFGILNQAGYLVEEFFERVRSSRE